MLGPMAGDEQATEALDLADEALARADVEGGIVHLSAAIRGFTAVDDKRRAAMACVRLADILANVFGNLTASRAWLTRARRLLENEPPCIEQGWVAVGAMGCEVEDPAQLLAAADLALDRARRFGDVNLETKALADAGLAHVQAGRVDKGMALLDEAMALACGPADDADTAAKSVCSFFTACYYAADFERAGSWTDLLRQRGLIGPVPGGPVFLSSHCDSVQATLLVELGRWGEAESVLERARSEFETVMHSPSWHPDIALADLRIRQSRFVEAEELLLGKDQSLQALLPAARLHLARGDHDLACATARRGLRVIGEDRLRGVELLTVLVDAELARGEVEAAKQALADLTARARRLDIVPLGARVAGTRARVQAASGELGAAIEALEATVDELDAQRLPWLTATLLIALARLREQVGDEVGTTLDAKAAAAVLATLDVVLPPADVALLEHHGHGTAGEGPAETVELRRDGKWWVVASGGTSVRLRDTKGLRYLAELVARRGVECHALDLVDRVEGLPAEAGVDRRALGDAGAILDSRARAAYRRRIEALRAQADEALATGDLDAAEVRQAELDQLVSQLAQAFGLGGRDRRAASAAERARLNVTRALRSAIGKVAEAMPGVGPLLDRGVRTGLYCTFEPAPGDEVRWIVQS
jgi:hypothetical protein